MSCRVLYCGLAGVLVVLVLTAGLVSTADAEVIAEWNFNGDAPERLADSSGNGNHLQQIGTTYWGAGLAAFGPDPGRLATIAPLDLSPYRWVRLSWSMLNLNSAGGVVFDQGWIGAGPSAFIVGTNSDGTSGTGSAGLMARPAGTTTFTGYAHEFGTGNTVWADYAVEVDLDAALPADQIKIFKDGVNIGVVNSSGALPLSMPNDIFTIGAL